MEYIDTAHRDNILVSLLLKNYISNPMIIRYDDDDSAEISISEITEHDIAYLVKDTEEESFQVFPHRFVVSVCVGDTNKYYDFFTDDQDVAFAFFNELLENPFVFTRYFRERAPV